MKIDQLIIGTYLGMGLVSGYLSNHFVKMNNLTLSLLLPLIFYIVSQPILLKFVSQKKKSWLVSNSFTTFFLIWILVWVTLYNL